jgi:UDPglucose 6-dehydrogenase
MAMKNNKTITVLGAGYVGLTTAALLAHSGFKVFAIEPNKARLDVIKKTNTLHGR